MRFRHYDTRDLSCLACLGDSLTAIRPADGTQLADTFTVKIAAAYSYARSVNAGVAGNKASDMLARLQPDVLNYRPGRMMVMCGHNEVSSNISGGVWVGGGVTAATMKANIKAIVLACQNVGMRTTVATPNPWRIQVALDNFGPYLTALSEAASETGSDFFDVYARYLTLDSTTLDTLYLSDNEHPNVAGHTYIAGMAAEVGFASCFSQPSPR